MARSPRRARTVIDTTLLEMTCHGSFIQLRSEPVAGALSRKRIQMDEQGR